MNKKFKELRMFILCFVLFAIFFSMMIYYVITHSTTRAIAMAIFSFIALTLVLGRYHMVLFDDSMVLYELKLAAMLPVVVNYKDITNIEIKSKHHLIVHHQYPTHVYVFNSEAFLKAYHQLRGESS